MKENEKKGTRREEGKQLKRLGSGPGPSAVAQPPLIKRGICSAALPCRALYSVLVHNDGVRRMVISIHVKKENAVKLQSWFAIMHSRQMLVKIDRNDI
jgi:hypothetical protein